MVAQGSLGMVGLRFGGVWAQVVGVMAAVLLAGSAFGVQAAEPDALTAAKQVINATNLRSICLACFSFEGKKKKAPASLKELAASEKISPKTLTNPLTGKQDYQLLSYDAKGTVKQIIIAEQPGSAADSLSVGFKDGSVRRLPIQGKAEQEKFFEALKTKNKAELLAWREKICQTDKSLSFFISGE